MDRELIEEYRKTMKRRRDICSMLLLGAILVGLAVMFVPLLSNTGLRGVMDDDHMTDDSIAYRDLENATFTWSAEEINELVDDNYYVAMLGGAIVASTYVGFLVLSALTPSKEKDHKRYCTDLSPYTITGWENVEVKYCPECGIDLKKLKE